MPADYRTTDQCIAMYPLVANDPRTASPRDVLTRVVALKILEKLHALHGMVHHCQQEGDLARLLELLGILDDQEFIECAAALPVAEFVQEACVQLICLQCHTVENDPTYHDTMCHNCGSYKFRRHYIYTRQE